MVDKAYDAGVADTQEATGEQIAVIRHECAMQGFNISHIDANMEPPPRTSAENDLLMAEFKKEEERLKGDVERLKGDVERLQKNNDGLFRGYIISAEVIRKNWVCESTIRDLKLKLEAKDKEKSTLEAEIVGHKATIHGQEQTITIAEKLMCTLLDENTKYVMGY